MKYYFLTLLVAIALFIASFGLTTSSNTKGVYVPFDLYAGLRINAQTRECRGVTWFQAWPLSSSRPTMPTGWVLYDTTATTVGLVGAMPPIATPFGTVSIDSNFREACQMLGLNHTGNDKYNTAWYFFFGGIFLTLLIVGLVLYRKMKSSKLKKNSRN